MSDFHQEEALVPDEGEAEVEAPSEHWLVSYADLMTLLFGFFAMLYLTKVLAPPPPPPPAAVAAASVTPQAVLEVGAPKAEEKLPTTEAGSSTGAGGGNFGFEVIELIPRGLLIAMLCAFSLYLLLYLLGFKNRHPAEDIDGFAKGHPLQPGPLLLAAEGAAKSVSGNMDDSQLDPSEMQEETETGQELGHASDEKWLISYADLMTLLFGFYAMLFLMGDNFSAVKESMDKTFKQPEKVAPEPIAKAEPPSPAPPLPPPPPPPQTEAVAPPLPPSPAPISVTEVSKETRTETKPPTPQKTLQEMEEERISYLKERMAKRGGAGRGNKGGTGEGDGPLASGNEGPGNRGRGAGNGKGDGIGSGVTGAAGTTLCGEGAVMAYRPSCSGNGLIGCAPKEWMYEEGGTNGRGSAVEFYCSGGVTRICLTFERCPWRSSMEKPADFPNGFQGGAEMNTDTMNCSPMGLSFTGEEPAHMVTCAGFADCGFKFLFCAKNGRAVFDKIK